MEHAKKLVLVDPNMYRPTLPEKSLSRLDEEIRATLNSDLPDDEKAKQYAGILKKFRSYDTNTKPPATKKDIEAELIESLSPSIQHKAKRMMRFINKNPAVDWTEKGELIYKQSVIPNSNIVDLVDDALASKKPPEGPLAWESFDDVLETSNVPSSLVIRRVKKGKRAKREQKWITK